MKPIILVGSSRKNGETNTIVQQIQQRTNWDAIHLSDYQISYYDYEHANANDDYLDLMKQLLANYDTFLFATPVYWYSMSGIMKVFFDRMTDLLTIEKATGRLLRGKNMAVVSSSYGNNLGAQFWLPFKASADYLGMNYLGNIHTLGDQDNQKPLNHFITTLQQH